MPTTESPTDLAQRIQDLLGERQQHAAALARIDETLRRVGAALGEGSTGAAPPSPDGSNGRSAAAKPAGKKKQGRGRSSFATTGEESVLSFVKQHKNPTGREIEAHWKGEGRGGSAANPLTKLVKEKKLRREPLEGERGSRYSTV